MRFLCLHGMGTNADIFETQLAPFIARYSSEHTFDFIDAEHECPPAPGISTVFPPPYLAWHTKYEPEHIQAAQDFLRLVIEEDGPYDGVIGFSQGAALAASLILCDEYHMGTNSKGPPFKIAAFFNCVMLFSPSQEIGSHIGKEVREIEEKYAAFLEGREVGGPSIDNEVSNLTTSLYQNIYGFPENEFTVHISIPTLHVLGTQDQFKEHSQALTKLCESDKTEILALEVGHEIPRNEAMLEKCWENFELVVMMARLSS